MSATPLRLALIRGVVAAALLGLLVACAAHVDSYIAPGQVLDTQAAYFIVVSPTDPAALHRDLRDALSSRGLRASSGPAGQEPPESVYRIEYYGQWQKDVDWYLLEFEFRIYEAKTGLIVASARSFRSSLNSRARREVVEEAVEQILPRAPGPAKQLQ